MSEHTALRTLKLLNSRIDAPNLIRLYPFFSALQNLDLWQTPVYNYMATAMAQSSMQCRRVFMWLKTDSIDPWHMHPFDLRSLLDSFPSLRELAIKADWPRNWSMNYKFDDVLRSHHSLRSLHIKNCGWTGLGKQHVLQIVSTCTNLRGLNIDQFERGYRRHGR